MSSIGVEDGASRHPSAHVWFWVAAALGSVHATWSLYWAVGGTWMLESVGQWAVDAADARPLTAFAVLGATAVAKLAGAWIPVLAENGRLPGRRLWRALSWAGGVGLVLYGGANIVASGAVLVGWIDSPGANTMALAGHALIWGPLFLLWGMALCLALARTRTQAPKRR